MDKLLLTGSAFERGVIHGKHYAERIQQKLVGLDAELEKRTIKSMVDQTVDLTETICPEINQEIRGIAVGANLDFELVFLHNNRCIIEVSSDNCSNVGIVRDGKMAVGMNKDISVAKRDHYFLRQSMDPSGNGWLGYGHLGRVWGMGLNNRGLCVAGTAAYPAEEKWKFPSVGVYLLGPIVLSQCGCVSDAVELIMSMETISEGGNLLLADKSREMLVLEIAPGGNIIRKAENGIIASTNFYASGKISHRNDPEYLAETMERYRVIREMLTDKTASPVKQVKMILATHRAKGSVCRHEDSLETVLSWVALPAEGMFIICDGKPCKNPYTTHVF